MCLYFLRSYTVQSQYTTTSSTAPVYDTIIFTFITLLLPFQCINTCSFFDFVLFCMATERWKVNEIVCAQGTTSYIQQTEFIRGVCKSKTINTIKKLLCSFYFVVAARFAFMQFFRCVRSISKVFCQFHTNCDRKHCEHLLLCRLNFFLEKITCLKFRKNTRIACKWVLFESFLILCKGWTIYFQIFTFFNDWKMTKKTIIQSPHLFLESYRPRF